MAGDAVYSLKIGPYGNLVTQGVEEWADEAQHSIEKGARTDHRVPQVLGMLFCSSDVFFCLRRCQRSVVCKSWRPMAGADELQNGLCWWSWRKRPVHTNTGRTKRSVLTASLRIDCFYGVCRLLGVDCGVWLTLFCFSREWLFWSNRR